MKRTRASSVVPVPCAVPLAGCADADEHMEDKECEEVSSC